jgi:hypothetical protein
LPLLAFGYRSGVLPRFLTRRFRFLWWPALLGALWANRRDVARWWAFVKRVVTDRRPKDYSDLMTEARVRAAVSADPMLRRDPALDDLSYGGGVVTLRTRTPTWPDRERLLSKLLRVRGINDVVLLDGNFAGP